ncbi:MAG: DUF2264 domain-containing protein [Candidatus Brocadiia bacterium]
MELTAPEDRDLSPFTGWTRAHWQELHAHLVRGTFRYGTPGRAQVHFPGRSSYNGYTSDGMEGYARTFFMNGPFLRGSRDGVLEFEGETFDVAEFYRRGIVNGTDPDHEEYWAGLEDHSQAIVEGAAIAMNLFFSREHVWDRLSEEEQQQVADYLYQLAECEPWANNWMQFSAVMHATLKRFGMRYNQAKMDRWMERMYAFYEGDGWYRDGEEFCFDYYNPWVIHPYFLIWTMINPGTDENLVESLKARTREFTSHYRYFFAGNGAYVPYGRSLVYRAAAVAVFPIAELFDCSAVPPGQARRICSGNVKYFAERGAVSDEDCLEMGFHGRYMPLLERYSGPQSPYWMAKAFWTFLLPPESSFWTATEAPNEVEKDDFTHVIPSTGMILHGEKETGQVTLFANNAHEWIERKYNNFCYSSHFGPEIAKVDDSYNCDNCLVTTEEGEHFHFRQLAEHVATADRFTASRYVPDDEHPENTVQTCIVLKGDYHLRLHDVTIEHPTQVVEGGIALCWDEGEPEIESGDGWEYARCGERMVFLQNLHGWAETVPAQAWGGDPEGNNLLARYSVVPYLKTEESFTGTAVLASLATARLRPTPADELAALVREVSVEDGTVFVTFGDGERALVQFDPVEPIGVEMNGVCVSGEVRFARVSERGEGLMLLSDGSWETL